MIGHWYFDTMPASTELATTITDPKLTNEHTPETSPFARFFLSGPWDFFNQHPERGARFAAAMTEFTRGVGYASLVTDFDWQGSLGKDATFVDVGGGVGTFAKMIADKYPSWRYVVQDLPDQLAHAPAASLSFNSSAPLMTDVEPASVLERLAERQGRL